MIYKILFAGLGSIGKRHVKNLVKYLNSRGDEVIIDAVRSGSVGPVQDDDVVGYIRDYYSYNDKIEEKYDILFVTNPTSKHFDTIKQYVSTARHMFIEKPVFSEDDVKIEDLSCRKDAVYYVACPLRYNAVLQYVHDHISCQDAIAVRSISSSYLPDWRPGQDYRETYSAHKKFGGGVSIDLVHEWDYLTWLFGKPEQVQCVIGTHSKLEIDSDDVALYLGKSDKLSYELHLDYFGRSTIRELQIFLPEETVEADIAKGEIRFLKEGKIVDLSEERDYYQIRELEHFFNILEGKSENDNSMENALSNLRLAKGFV